VSITLYLDRYTSDDVVKVMSLFDYEESYDGVTLRPRDKGVRYFSDFANGTNVHLDDPDMGLLRTAPLSSEVAKILPRHEGAPAAGGQVYQEGYGDGESYFMLVGPTSVTQILPHAWHDPATVLESVVKLEVDVTS
jgi:hypothetical protein